MIPAAFDYAAPTSLEEALRCLVDGGEDAKVLAGGHSLLPLMKLRLATPELVIDLGRIDDLRYIRQDEDCVDIGAMTEYATIHESPIVRRAAPMLAQAASLVGDAQVRHRGTIGGALAHADPAGDLPGVMIALAAVIHSRSSKGGRATAARDFFAGMFETVLDPDEIITHIRLPVSPTPAQFYEKFRRRLCDWAIVGSAVSLAVEDGRIRSAKVVLTNVGPMPMVATGVEESLAGSDLTPDSLAAAAGRGDEGLDPTPELNASTDYKRHLARVITRRALEQAVRAGGWPVAAGT